MGSSRAAACFGPAQSEPRHQNRFTAPQLVIIFVQKFAK